MTYLTLPGAAFLYMCLSGLAQANAAPGEAIQPRYLPVQREVSGLVVGQTMTLAGRTFYDSFSSAWSDKDPNARFSVAISERPTARLGSQVFVDYGNRRLFQAFLPPNRALIPAIGADAAAQVYQAILDYQVAQFFGDPDMGRDEL